MEQQERKTDRGGNLSAEPIFALDIGTHSVIGIVGTCEGDLFHVLGITQREYTRRAMRDGQIEDIEQVATTAQSVRRELEEKLGLTLSSVYVAAAGRSLRTQRASFELELTSGDPVTPEMVSELEMGAIQQAEEKILAETQETDVPLYYVGHSVIHYYLDDYQISTLLGHRGKRVRAEIIATFLPGEVLESLHAAMQKNGLTVSSVTLEPIAAMNAIIPAELRLLNLTLVDIGAGTSDIAISDGGSVVAYTMATVAGDEITEEIVRRFLVDFAMAEKMKMALSTEQNSIPYQNILGMEYTVSREELTQAVAPAMEGLCQTIADRILEINGKAPAAVFMVGGGSKLKGIAPMLAQKLSMEENKVAVGGSNYMKRMVISDLDVGAAEYATPMGIALTAMTTRNDQRYSVTLNGKEVQIVTQNPATLMELLMMNGYGRSQLLGRSGKSVTFEVDGRKRVVRGGLPTPASVTINEKPANITTPVHAGDRIELTPAQAGEDAAVTVAQAVEEYLVFLIRLNGVNFQVGTLVFCNGQPADGERQVQDLDVLEIHPVRTIEDLCHEIHLDPEGYQFLLNGELAAIDRTLSPEDDLRYHPLPKVGSEPGGSAGPSSKADATSASVPILENPSAASSGADQLSGTPAPNELGLLRVTLNGGAMRLPPKLDGTAYQFVDLLNFVEIDPKNPKGNILLRLNGHPASYLDVIRDGDAVEIRWDLT